MPHQVNHNDCTLPELRTPSHFVSHLFRTSAANCSSCSRVHLTHSPQGNSAGRHILLQIEDGPRRDVLPELSSPGNSGGATVESSPKGSAATRIGRPGRGPAQKSQNQHFVTWEFVEKSRNVYNSSDFSRFRKLKSGDIKPQNFMHIFSAEITLKKVDFG